MAADSVKSEVVAKHTRAVSIAFGIAAFPALFLPLSYIFMCGWALANVIFPAASGNYTEAHPIGFSILIVGGGLYGTLIQWPFYLIWAALSTELNWRLRLLWIIIIILFNMFAIPWFLYCKYRGTTKTTIINSIKVHWLRAYFDENAPPVSASLQQDDYKRQNVIMFRLLIITWLILSVSIYWDFKLLIGNIALRYSQDDWAVFAGSSLANKDFSKGQIGFYQIETVRKSGTIIGARAGYPVKAWPQMSSDYPDSTSTFIDNYNKTMLRLIKSTGSPK